MTDYTWGDIGSIALMVLFFIIIAELFFQASKSNITE